MKPIIVGVTTDGKVDMTLDEFRKYMDDAYYQGYRDNTPTLTASTYAGDSHSKWWNDVCTNLASTACDSATAAIPKEGR